MGFAPGRPKGIVVCSGVKKESQLANVMYHPVAQQYISEDMQGQISELVDMTETRKGDAFEAPGGPSFPKAINS